MSNWTITPIPDPLPCQACRSPAVQRASRRLRYSCGSAIYGDGRFDQSHRCRIKQLERKLDECTTALSNALGPLRSVFGMDDEQPSPLPKRILDSLICLGDNLSEGVSRLAQRHAALLSVTDELAVLIQAAFEEGWYASVDNTETVRETGCDIKVLEAFARSATWKRMAAIGQRHELNLKPKEPLVDAIAKTLSSSE